MPTATISKAAKSPKKKVSAKRTQSARKSKKTSADECPHCKSGPESFRYMGNIYRFDVDKARRLVSDGREPVELEPDDVQYSVDVSRIYPEHVKHVNPEFPGIIAHIWYPDPSGELLHGHVLIDGHHRAARCLELDRPYFVYLLSEEESREVLLEDSKIDQILKTVGAQTR